MTIPDRTNINFAFRVADFDGDNHVDLLILNNGAIDSNPAIYYHNNAGVFENPYSNPAASPFPSLGNNNQPARYVVGDFDSDGDADILYWDTSTGSAKLMLGGTFNTVDANAGGSPFQGVTLPNFSALPSIVADFDGDGDQDLYFGEANTDGYYFTQGAGSDGSPPIITASIPVDNDTGVSPTADITLTFDEAVTKGTTGNIYIVRTSDNTVVETIAVTSARVTAGSGFSWIVNPVNDLAGNTAYAVRIDAKTFVDTTGATPFLGIYDNTTLNFVTAVPNTPPSVSFTGVSFTDGGTSNSGD